MRGAENYKTCSANDLKTINGENKFNLYPSCGPYPCEIATGKGGRMSGRLYHTLHRMREPIADYQEKLGIEKTEWVASVISEIHVLFNLGLFPTSVELK